MKNINRSQVMKRAHEIAKTLVGDWYARLALALRQAWREAKNIVTKVIETITDAENFLNKLSELQIEDFRFLNETGFTTEYYTRSDKPGVFKKKNWGAGDDDWKTFKNVTADMILEDKELINKELEEGKRYWTNRGILT